MKSLVIFFLFFFSLKVEGQNLPTNSITKRIEYEEIFEYPNKTKTELYINMRDWIITNDMPIILLDSIGYNKIICERLCRLKWSDKGLLSTIGTKEYGIRYNIIADFKDGKLRCKISNVNFLEYKNPSAVGIYWGYGITTTNMNNGEIIKYDAEDFYPPEKNVHKYRDMYSYFFTNIDTEIMQTLLELKNYFNSSDNDW